MEKSLFSIDGASPQFHYTGIGDIVKGDVIRIDVKFICDSELYGIRNVILGSSGEIISTVFRSDLLGIVLCIALFCMGIILIMFYFAFRKDVSLHGVHYAGAFAVLASVYSISGSILLSSLEIVGADSLCIIRCLAYVTMFMPFILFFMENTKFRVSDRILQVASVIQAVVIAAIYILGISGAANIYRTRIIADISMLVQLLLILGVLIFDLNKNNEIELNKNLKIEESQRLFLETTLGKTINTAIDVGIRALLPEFIDEQIINIKDNLLNYGLKDGIIKTIDDAIDLGKSALGIVTGNFESVSQMQNAVQTGGIIDGVSTLLDTVVDKARQAGLINYSVAKSIKQGKNIILNNVESNIEKSFENNLNSIEHTNKYINNWNKYFEQKDFNGMEKEYKKIQKEIKNLAPIENTIQNVKIIQNLHNLIKNNGQDFNLNKEQLELAEKLQ